MVDSLVLGICMEVIMLSLKELLKAKLKALLKFGIGYYNSILESPVRRDLLHKAYIDVGKGFVIGGFLV